MEKNITKGEQKLREATFAADNSKTNRKNSHHLSDVEILDRIVQKYPLTKIEKKIINKVISLLETYSTRCMLPTINVGDSVFKMYNSDEKPTEFVVDRIEFDEFGWRLISYEKFGHHEVEFIFCEKDYQKLFFDTAAQARKYYNK